MTLDNIIEWYEKQYKRTDQDAPFLHFYVDCIEWLIAEVERLQKELKCPDMKAVRAYDSGQRSAAMRCAEIANDCCRDSSGYNTGCDTEDQIRKEFRL